MAGAANWKLLEHVKGQNEEEGKDLLKGMIVNVDVFSRSLRDTLSSIQRDEIVREVTLTYGFQKKDARLVRAIVTARTKLGETGV